MREIKVYLAEFILVILTSIMLVVMTKTEYNQSESADFVEWNDAEWTVMNEDGIQSENCALPQSVESKKGTVWFQRELTKEDCGSNHSLVFLTVHSKVDVVVDGELIYSTSSEEVVYSKSRGHNWNCVNIEPKYEGKTLIVYLEYPYSSNYVAIPTLYLGNDLDISANYIQKQTPAFLTSLFTIILGFLLILMYLILGKDKRVERRLLWIGWFAMALGIWSITETNVLILYMKDTLFIGQIAFLSLKLTFTPVVMFYKESFHVKHEKFLFGLCIASFLDVIISTLLQVFAIADYRESLWITHAYMIIGVLFVFISVIYHVWKDGKTCKQKRGGVKNTLHTVGILIVAVCVTIDFIRYYAEIVHEDAAKFSRIGLLLYIIILGMDVIQNSLHLLEVENEAERLKEEALLDPVTHLSNRTSFDKDCSEIAKEERKKYGIIMCDLNGLKYFNDHYGHSMGDSYIFIAAEMICDTFTTYGKTYRVGGDEFVVLTTELSEEVFTEIYEKMNERIDSLSKSCFDERMGIAAGFAIFDPSLDSSLRDTEKRADEKMYIKKKEMKAKNQLYRRNEDGLQTGELQVENPILRKK